MAAEPASWYGRSMSQEDTVAPGPQASPVTTTTLVPRGEDEIVAMIREESEFSVAPELRASVCRLLASGYTMRRVASQLNLQASTLWAYANDDEVQSARERGRLRRQAILSERLEAAADRAVTALVDVADDPDVSPRDRVKAAEAILDRSGITPLAGRADGQTAISVDIDFDDRLARIVAGTSSGGG